MNSKKIISSLLISFFIFTGCEEPPTHQCFETFDEQVQVSIYLLLSRPECFRSRNVEFSGIIGWGNGNIVVFPTETDYLTNNFAASIYVNSKLSTSDYNKLTAIPHGQYVKIGGVFEVPSGLSVSVFPKVLELNVNREPL